jgi:hypothetical protein
VSATRTKESPSGELEALQEWPVRTVAVLTTLDDVGPHAIPVSAPVRAGDHRILLSLRHDRDSLTRLREHPRVAITILAAKNVAFTARGEAHIVQAAMSTSPDFAAVEIEVDEIDDHRQPAFVVEAGVDRRWLDTTERDALGQRVRSLTAMAAEPAFSPGAENRRQAR